ncbi:MAG: hypothetical protein BWY38_03265 [Ignavibacteria bacterium ADurb.Bin266]|nr:MAG: hypothetical protein BWY38_03265 [Ignavibacteria bacterium ADurb.Bin266]
MKLTKQDLIIISDALISELERLAGIRNALRPDNLIRVIDEQMDDVRNVLTKINDQMEVTK